MKPTSYSDALAHYSKGEFQRALQLLDALSVEESSAFEVLELRGATLARLGRSDEAIQVLERLDPPTLHALTWLATLLRKSDPEQALAYAQRAVQVAPAEAEGYGTLGSHYLGMGRSDEAIQTLNKAVELAPSEAAYRYNLALALLSAHQHGEAIRQLTEAHRLDPDSLHNPLLLAQTYLQFGKAAEALDVLLPILRRHPNAGKLHSTAASAYATLRNDEVAENHYRKAAELSPDGRSAYATWLVNQGRTTEATRSFESLMGTSGITGYALYSLGLLRKYRSPEDDGTFLETLEAELGKPGLVNREAMFLHYGLGRGYEQTGQYELGMVHFNAANAAAHRQFHQGRPARTQSFDEEHAADRELYASLSEAKGLATDAPIFIVGMIRSGTTLLDQIVSSHPEVASGGELRFWMEESKRAILQGKTFSSAELTELAQEYLGYARLLAGTEGRFTDKMPLNFAHLGLIHRALPNARFLHIRRHPVDTCLSIWTTYFGQGPVFAYDKTTIVDYYQAYLRAIEEWRKVIPDDRLLELDYEALIDDPEPTIRKVIEFCGLPWDEACLHHDQNRSAILTPSRLQARQPIYRTSIARWKKVEPWLGEFARLLPAES